LIDDGLDGIGCEDRSSLSGGQGEALCDQRVLPGTAGILKGRAEIADREGRASPLVLATVNPLTVSYGTDRASILRSPTCLPVQKH